MAKSGAVIMVRSLKQYIIQTGPGELGLTAKKGSAKVCNTVEELSKLHQLASHDFNKNNLVVQPANQLTDKAVEARIKAAGNDRELVQIEMEELLMQFLYNDQSHWPRAIALFDPQGEYAPLSLPTKVVTVNTKDGNTTQVVKVG